MGAAGGRSANGARHTLSTQRDGSVSADRRKQHVLTATQEDVGCIAFAEGASLQSTLGECKSWFVRHIWDLDLHLRDRPSGMLANIGSDVLGRFIRAVAKAKRTNVERGRHFSPFG